MDALEKCVHISFRISLHSGLDSCVHVIWEGAVPDSREFISGHGLLGHVGQSEVPTTNLM